MASTEVGSVHYTLDLLTGRFDGKISKASRTFETLGRKAGNTGRNISSTLGGSLKRLSSQAASTGSAFASSMGTIIKRSGLAGIAVGGIFAKSSIDKFKLQEQALAQIDAGLKSTQGAAGLTREALQEMASELQRNSTFGDEDILKNVSAQFLTFGNITEDVFGRAQSVALDLSARLDQDLKSSSIQLGKALDDPVKGINALSRVGVSFTADQKDLVKQLVETGDTLGAQNLILGELEKQYGGSAAAAADTFSGKQQQLANRFGDIQEIVGGALIPVLVTVADKFVTLFENLATGGGVFETIRNSVQSVGNVFRLLATGDFSGGIFGFAEDSSFVDFLFNLRDGAIAFGQAIVGAIPAVRTLFTSVIKPLGAFLISTFRPVFDSLVQLITGSLVPAFQRLLPVIKVVGIIIGGALLVALKAISIALRVVIPVIGFFVTVWSTVVATLFSVASVVVSFVADVIGYFTDFKSRGEGILSGLSTVIKFYFNTYRTIIVGIFKGVAFFVTNFWKGLKIIFETYVKIVRTLITTWAKAVRFVITTAFNAIRAYFTTVFRVIKTLVTTSFNFYRRFITAAATKIRSVVLGAFDRIRRGVGAVLSAIRSVVSSAFNFVRSSVSRGAEGARAAAVSAFNRLRSGVTGAISRVVSLARGFGGRIKSAVGNLGSILTSAGRDVISGLISGITGSAGRLISSIQSTVTNALPGFVKKALGIQSPSKVFAGFGKNIIEGLVEGIDGQKRSLEKSIQAITNAATVDAQGRFGLDASGSINAPAPVGGSSFDSRSSNVTNVNSESQASRPPIVLVAGTVPGQTFDENSLREFGLQILASLGNENEQIRSLLT